MLLVDALFSILFLIDKRLHKCFRKTEGGRRKGFMGHLTKMANAVTSAVEKGCNSELIKKYLTGKRNK